MATETKLRQLADKECPVYYFYSSERYLVRQAVAAATRILTADSDEDATVLDGAPCPILILRCIWPRSTAASSAATP